MAIDHRMVRQNPHLFPADMQAEAWAAYEADLRAARESMTRRLTPEELASITDKPEPRTFDSAIPDALFWPEPEPKRYGAVAVIVMAAAVSMIALFSCAMAERVWTDDNASKVETLQ